MFNYNPLPIHEELIKTLKFKSLKAEYKETFCKLEFSEPELRYQQKITAEQLKVEYETKRLETAHNAIRIANAEKVIDRSVELPTPDANKKFTFSFRPWIDKFTDWYKSLSLNAFLNYVQGWITSPRLFSLRNVRILIFDGLLTAQSIVAQINRYLGLSYIISIVPDTWNWLNEAFRPLTETEKEKGFTYWESIWPRIVDSMTENDEVGNGGIRWYRYINDNTWFYINLVGIVTGVVLATGLAFTVLAITNLIGFFIDVCNESVLALVNYLEFSIFQDEIEDRLKKLDAIKTQVEYEENEKAVSYVDEMIRQHQLVHEQLDQKKKTLVRTGLRIFTMLSLVLIGMVLVFYPPTAIAGAKFIGSGMALLYGSGNFVTGFTSKMFTWIGKRVCELFDIKESELTELKNRFHHAFIAAQLIGGVVLGCMAIALPVFAVPAMILLFSGTAFLAVELLSPYVPDALKAIEDSVFNRTDNDQDAIDKITDPPIYQNTDSEVAIVLNNENSSTLRRRHVPIRINDDSSDDSSANDNLPLSNEPVWLQRKRAFVDVDKCRNVNWSKLQDKLYKSGQTSGSDKEMTACEYVLNEGMEYQGLGSNDILNVFSSDSSLSI